MSGPVVRSRWRRVLRVGLVVFGMLVAAAAVVGTIHRDFFLLRFGVVKEHVLYRTSQLDVAALDDVVTDEGIRTIVNLCVDDLPSDRDVAAARGARYVWLPSTQVPPDEVVAGFLDVMRDPKNHPVLLHCEHGVGRTGALVGVYRLEFEGAAISDVLAEARRHATYGSFEPGSSKAVFLEEYAKKLAARRSPR
jgi:protein tyrosine/serine phosphatase